MAEKMLCIITIRLVCSWVVDFWKLDIGLTLVTHVSQAYERVVLNAFHPMLVV